MYPSLLAVLLRNCMEKTLELILQKVICKENFLRAISILFRIVERKELLENTLNLKVTHSGLNANIDACGSPFDRRNDDRRNWDDRHTVI
jgi:hypothetical protein